MGGRRAGTARAAALVAALAGALAPARAAAQIAAVRPLAFGTIVTGTTTTVAPANPGAAAWHIRGILGISGGITLTLPTHLTRVGGGATMPVTFCTTCAAYRLNNASPAGATAFNPAVGLHGLYVVVLTDIYLWLGGAVSPPLNQPPGRYVGTAVLTVSALL